MRRVLDGITALEDLADVFLTTLGVCGNPNSYY